MLHGMMCRCMGIGQRPSSWGPLGSSRGRPVGGPPGQRPSSRLATLRQRASVLIILIITATFKRVVADPPETPDAMRYIEYPVHKSLNLYKSELPNTNPDVKLHV